MSEEKKDIIEKAIKGYYEIIKKIGQGKFGVIFLVKMLKDGKEYILKCTEINKDSIENRLCYLLEHKNITYCYESFIHGKYLYLVYEYANGGDLKHFLREKNLSEKDVKKIILDILHALEYCHSLQICHNDLKPENILVFIEKDNNITYKLTDWGISSEKEGLVKRMRGTPYYIAPEVFQKLYYYCDKTDIWSVGVITYYCLEHKYPFNGETDKDFVISVCNDKPKFSSASPQAQEFILKLLSKNPKNRPSVKEILKESWLN